MDYTFTREQFNQARVNLDLMTALQGRVAGISHAPGMVIVHVVDELTEAELAQAQGVVDTHDPANLTDDQIAAAQIAAVEAAALPAVQNIPGWAAWSEAQVLAYIDAEVVDLASAIVVLKAMARMLVALRNAQWPQLEDEAA